MFEFGDELTLESGYRIPLLIWVQMLVLFLLIFLLYCFSLFPLDLQQTSPSATSSHPNHHTSTILNRNCSQVEGNQMMKGEVASGRSRRVEENTDREARLQLHPCYYLKLARSAFLKCLGLDSSSDNSEQRKQS